jgi:SAM-dependent MidA family methyltransferase
MSAARVLVRPDASPTPDEALHVERVSAHLRAEIAASDGWIDFERYMDMVLYAPGLGYYSAGAHKLGRGGDFTTAPEISPLFGACVAQQCCEVLRDLGGGTVLEIGAGSGRLAADVLLRLEMLGQLPAKYRILEISADLRERQRRTLAARAPQLAERVEWLDAPPAAAFDGLILANEVLDALPVVRFRWYRSHCEELGVACEDGRFVWAARPASETTSWCARRWRRPGGSGRRATSRSIARGCPPSRRR